MISRRESSSKSQQLALGGGNKSMIRTHSCGLNDTCLWDRSFPQMRLICIKAVPDSRLLGHGIGKIMHRLDPQLAVVVVTPREDVAVFRHSATVHATNGDMIDAFPTEHGELYGRHEVFLTTIFVVIRLTIIVIPSSAFVCWVPTSSQVNSVLLARRAHAHVTCVVVVAVIIVFFVTEITIFVGFLEQSLVRDIGRQSRRPRSLAPYVDVSASTHSEGHVGIKPLSSKNEHVSIDTTRDCRFPIDCDAVQRKLELCHGREELL